jgi:hypothetical protein
MCRRPTIRKTRNSVSLVAFAVLFFVTPLHSQDPDSVPTQERPILQINLHKFGYNSKNAIRLNSPVQFTDSNRIAIGWVSVEDPRGVPAPSPSDKGTSQLHLLFLDARTGKNRRTETWPAPVGSVSVVGLSDGEFLTCTGNIAKLFSSDLELIQTGQLPGTSYCGNNCTLPSHVVSPDKSRWLICSCVDCSGEWSARKYQNTLIDTDHLLPISTFGDPRPIRGVSSYRLVADGDREGELYIRTLEESWKSLRPIGLGEQFGERGKYKYQSGWFPSFVNDTTLLIEAGGSMAVVSVDCTVLFQQQLPTNRFFGNHVVSAESDRFAVMETRLRGPSSEALDMAFDADDRVVVFGVSDRKAIFAVKVEGVSAWDLLSNKGHRNQIALSPDGQLLAIVSDETLRIYQLPKSQ